MSKWFVFVKINGDHQQAEVARFNVSGYPTIKFMKTDEAIVHEMVGFRPIDGFLAEMEKAKANAGIGE